MNKQKLIRLISLALILVMVWPATGGVSGADSEQRLRALL